MPVDCPPTPPPFIAIARSDYGLSDTADIIRRLLNDVRHSSSSIVYGHRKDEAYQTLRDLYISAAANDGEEPVRISLGAFKYSSDFIRALPAEVPLPDITADPDGEIALDWEFARRQRFSVSVGRDGRLTYAGILGSGRRHGTIQYVDGIPEAITQILSELLRSNGTAHSLGSFDVAFHGRKALQS